MIMGTTSTTKPQARYVYGAFSDHAMRCPQCRKYVAEALTLAALVDLTLAPKPSFEPCEEGKKLLATIFD